MDPKKFDPLPKLSVEYLLRDLPLPTPAVLQQALRYEALPPLSTGKECLHLRGLPDDAQPETIIEFLGREARSVIDKGVHIIYNAEGRPSGEAIIQMKSEESAFWAVAHSHDRYMMGPSQKPSRIEALLCSVKEMKAKLASSVLGPFPPSLARDPQQELYDAINNCRPPVLPQQPSAMAAASPSSAPPTFVPPGMPWSPPNLTASAEACSLNVVTMLLVRNLPDSATVRDITAFFKGCLGLEPGGVYMMHLADRRFKDSAFVAVPCDAAAVRAFLDRQCHYIGNRKVDLSIVDTGSVLRWLGAPSRAHLYNVAAPLPYAGK